MRMQLIKQTLLLVGLLAGSVASAQLSAPLQMTEFGCTPTATASCAMHASGGSQPYTYTWWGSGNGEIISPNGTQATVQKICPSADSIIYGRVTDASGATVNGTAVVRCSGGTTIQCNARPATPNGFNAQVYGGGLVILGWYPPRCATSIEIFRRVGGGGAVLDKTVPGDESATDVSVGGNTYFKVRACNAYGCSGFTHEVLTWFQPCGGLGQPACE